MRIRELTLRNFRAHGEPDPFPFSVPFTVIAGINGRGKTALLDGLALLCSRFLPLVSPARSGYRAITPSDVRNQEVSAELRMKVTCVDIPLEFKLTYDRATKTITPTKLGAAVRSAVKMAYGNPHRIGDAAPLAVYYTTDRAGYRLPKKLPTEVPRGQSAAYAGALFNRTVNFRDFMARYRNAIMLDRTERRGNPFYLGDVAVAAISQALGTFLGGFTNLRVEEEPLRLLVNKGNETLDLSQLSDGERSFLALVCDLGRRLALANPDRTVLANPLHGAGVVLIDELELHLHPKWQREVSQKLRETFPNIQFIATTHSPFIIQSLRPGELINLDPDEDGEEYANKSIEDIAEAVMGVEMPQKSERYRKMIDVATRYYSLLETASSCSADEIEQLKRDLDATALPYSNDPAFAAFLNFQRGRYLQEDE